MVMIKYTKIAKKYNNICTNTIGNPFFVRKDLQLNVPFFISYDDSFKPFFPRVKGQHFNALKSFQTIEELGVHKRKIWKEKQRIHQAILRENKDKFFITEEEVMKLIQL